MFLLSIISFFSFHAYIEIITNGNYSVRTSIKKTLINGTGIIDASIETYYGNYDDNYYLFIQFSSRSSGNIIPIGLTYINTFLYKNGNPFNHKINVISPPKVLINDLFCNEFIKEDNLTCKSMINASFLTKNSEIIQNTTFSIKLTLIFPFTISKIDFEVRLPAIWVYFLIIVIMGYIFYKIIQAINRIRFDLFYTEKLREKDKEFYKYLTDWKKEKFENNSSE